jgi:hypothetical protein
LSGIFEGFLSPPEGYHVALSNSCPVIMRDNFPILPESSMDFMLRWRGN